MLPDYSLLEYGYAENNGVLLDYLDDEDAEFVRQQLCTETPEPQPEFPPQSVTPPAPVSVNTPGWRAPDPVIAPVNPRNNPLSLFPEYNLGPNKISATNNSK